MSARLAADIAELIGDTPLIHLRNITADLPPNVEVHVKAEWFNPGGSVKDRAARNIVREAIKRGDLGPGKTLLDSSSGNTGIAYAMLGAALGFPVLLCIPANANPERQRTLRAYGAELVLTDPAEGSDGAMLEAKRIEEASRGRYFYANQYGSADNWRAHYLTTGPELVAQTQGRITHFVAGLGTSGTCMGVGRYLRDHAPSARVVAFQPDSPFHGLEGMKHMETAVVPGIYDASVPHEQRTVQTERAYATCKRAARQDGVFLGISAGASLSIALDLAREAVEAKQAAVIVSLGCDGGARYLSEALWDTEAS